MNTNKIAVVCLIVYGVTIGVGSVVTEDMTLWLTEISIPVMAVVTIAYLHRELRLSALSYLSITFLVLLHAVVAIHPMATSPLGVNLGALLGWHRNNIDHVLHFASGLCLWRPVFEIVESCAQPKRVANAVISVALVLSLSAAYELLEWKSVIMLGEKNADLFLGWQGDAWDAQKDMGLNLAGAALAAIIDCSLRLVRRKVQGRS